MKIAVTSGKGGSGKTLLATCLAETISKTQPVTYIDCDVEAPNGHLFIKPEYIDVSGETNKSIESIDLDKCVFCGKCAKACFMNAIIVGRENAMVFPELCRYCGSCEVVCKQQALVKGSRIIGKRKTGKTRNIEIKWAELATGAGGMTTTLIKNLTKNILQDDITIIDSPPGTSCPVVETVKDADIVVLAADPTRFGMHDLKLSVAMCRKLNIEPLVIINRVGIGHLEDLIEWCRQQQLTIIGELPDSREIAECYSRGLIATEQIESIKEIFESITEKILSHKHGQKADIKIDQNLYLAEAKTRKSATSNNERKTGAFEIAVLSGKGGSGKTSIAACLGQLSDSVIADCDVDAADMHLLLNPTVQDCSDFIGGNVMQIDTGKCHPCGDCKYVCQFGAVEKTGSYGYKINEDKCEGCGACLELCPRNAIYSKPSVNGRMYLSETRFGKLSHATLAPGQENSGKLVTTVRSQAAGFAQMGTVIIDGSPGTGCPVIASIGGVKMAVLVTEPTLSGLHDLKRIYDLCRHFKVPAKIIINKADINIHVTGEIEEFARANSIEVAGKLYYSDDFNMAQQQGKTILEYSPESENAVEINKIWKLIKKEVQGNNESAT